MNHLSVWVSSQKERQIVNCSKLDQVQKRLFQTPCRQPTLNTPRQHRQAQETGKSSPARRAESDRAGGGREVSIVRYFQVITKPQNQWAHTTANLGFTLQAPRVEFPKAIIRIHFIKLSCLTSGYCIRLQSLEINKGTTYNLELHCENDPHNLKIVFKMLAGDNSQLSCTSGQMNLICSLLYNSNLLVSKQEINHFEHPDIFSLANFAFHSGCIPNIGTKIYDFVVKFRFSGTKDSSPPLPSQLLGL